jgi:hypothetical protein
MQLVYFLGLFLALTCEPVYSPFEVFDLEGRLFVTILKPVLKVLDLLVQLLPFLLLGLR